MFLCMFLNLHPTTIFEIYFLCIRLVIDFLKFLDKIISNDLASEPFTTTVDLAFAKIYSLRTFYNCNPNHHLPHSMQLGVQFHHLILILCSKSYECLIDFLGIVEFKEVSISQSIMYNREPGKCKSVQVDTLH